MFRSSWGKLQAIIIASLSVVLLGAFSVSASAQGEYVDVGKENVHYKGIMKLTGQGILDGYPDNHFKPWQDLSRIQAVSILADMSNYPKPENIDETLSSYKDVNSNSPNAEQIAMLTEADIFQGNDASKFKPHSDITRAQMASVLVKAMDLHGNEDKVNINLENVSAPHRDSVQTLANLQITDRLDNFGAHDSVTRGAAATLIYQAQSAGNFDLSIMHMNDNHGHAEPLPRMLTAIKQEREENPESLLFHGGDAFSGTLYFSEFHGQANMELFNLMDMTAMVYGNHEFDLGSEENGNKSLAKFVKSANFPMLGSNVDFSNDPYMNDLETNESLVNNPEAGEDYFSIVKDIHGEEVGIFGLDTEETAEISRPNDVTFSNYKDTARKAVQEFENAGIDKVIAVTHLGLNNQQGFGNDRKLAQIDGIDVIVGGHSHTAIRDPIVVDQAADGHEKDPTVIVQAGEKAEYLGKLDVEFDEDGVITEYSGELLNTDNYAADEEAENVLKKYSEKVEEVKNEEIGAKALQDIENSGTGVRETPIGNLVADAMLDQAQEKVPEAVIAFQNGGGIRESIEKGPITVGDVRKVLPFGNDPVSGTLTGKELKEVMEHSVHSAPDYHGGFLHVSGMKFKYDSDRGPGDRVTEMKVKQDGDFVDVHMDEDYVVITNEFTAHGGDGFETLKKADEENRFSDIGEVDWEQLRDYLIEREEVEPKVEGRIIDIADQE